MLHGMRSVTFMCPEPLVAAVEELAAADRRNRSDVLRLAVEEHLRAHGVLMPEVPDKTAAYRRGSAVAAGPAGWDVPAREADPLDSIA